MAAFPDFQIPMTLRLALPLLAALVLAGCSSTDPTTCDATGTVTTTEVTPGSGSAVAGPNSNVTVRYVGKLLDGTTFDQSENAAFNLAATVPGFRLGVTGMKIGGRRTIVIPPNLGYGAFPPSRSIPPCATLTFDVTLLDVR